MSASFKDLLSQNAANALMKAKESRTKYLQV